MNIKVAAFTVSEKSNNTFYFSGWLADITSSYNSSFLMVGACFLVSCVLTMIIPLRWNCSHVSRSQQYELEIPKSSEQTKVVKEK